MKKRPERRKHCALAVVRRRQKKFAPPQTPFPGAQDGQKLISWRWSLSLPTVLIKKILVREKVRRTKSMNLAKKIVYIDYRLV